MDTFYVGQQFDDFQSVLLTKRGYELASKIVLVKAGSHKLKDGGDFARSKVYDRIAFTRAKRENLKVMELVKYPHTNPTVHSW